LSDFYLDLHRSLADQGFAKSLDRSMSDIQGYAYQFSTWSTIEEAMESIGETPPER
jgi:hypothetical protein